MLTRTALSTTVGEELRGSYIGSWRKRAFRKEFNEGIDMNLALELRWEPWSKCEGNMQLQKREGGSQEWKMMMRKENKLYMSIEPWNFCMPFFIFSVLLYFSFLFVKPFS
ncbi:hypothetical protein Y032_0002g651 [Ancylostoma ceylanicum]|uniref:Transmembrane protein n=1 Tax=Ancylostoma ceylanicum TaxID=53326 RepID=A0A016W020_9BILA|nr:hypothetical protein Y032_0002g651 [Ancylostoma ceylanicum]